MPLIEINKTGNKRFIEVAKKTEKRSHAALMRARLAAAVTVSQVLGLVDVTDVVTFASVNYHK